MTDRLLFLDKLHCNIPTDNNSFNSRDEVYFLVAGAASGGRKIRVAPDPDHDDEDYYPMNKGQTLGNILLAQADLEEGGKSAFTVAICEQDNAQLGAIGDAIEAVALAALAVVTEGATAELAVEKFIQTGVDLVNSVTKSGDQVIGAFAVRIHVDHGNVKAVWTPVSHVTIQSSGDVRMSLHASGGGGNYDADLLVADATAFQVSGGLRHRGADKIQDVALSVITNGTQVLPATLLRSADDHLLAQVWDTVAASGALAEQSHLPALPATALATSGVGLGLTATVRDKANGGCKAILWALNGSKLALQDAAHVADAPVDFAVGRRGRDLLSLPVTATIGPDHKLVVDVWNEVLPSGDTAYKLKRVGTATETAISAQRVALAAWSKGIVTAVQEHGTNRLRLIAWTIADDGSLQRKGASTSGELQIDQVAVVNGEPRGEDPGNRVVTSVRASDRTLHVMVWHISDDGAKISLRDSDSPPAPAHVADLALTAMGPLVVVDKTVASGQAATLAVRQVGGKLRLTMWTISSNGRLSRAYDHDFEQAKSVSLDTWGVTGVTSGAGFSTTPGVNIAAAARMADDTLGLFVFVSSVNTTIS